MRFARRLLLILALVAVAAGAAVSVQQDLVTVVGKYFRLDDPTWDDLRIVPGSFDYAGSNDPALQNWQPGGSNTFKVYEFEPGDGGYFVVQLPHNRKPGTDLSAHIHWTPAARGNEEVSKTVAWKLDLSSASIDDTFPASAVYDCTDTVDGTDHKHQMSPSVSIPASSLGLSAMMTCRVFRDAGDSWATNSSGNCPVLLEVDFHYQIDRLGSDNVGTND